MEDDLRLYWSAWRKQWMIIRNFRELIRPATPEEIRTLPKWGEPR